MIAWCTWAFAWGHGSITQDSFIAQGAGGIGAPGTFCKVTDPNVAQSIIDTFSKCGPAVVNMSQSYGFGISEEVRMPTSH